MLKAATRELTEEGVSLDELLDSIGFNACKLVVHNDEVNTFEWVIESLVDICKHSLQQAEQSALIIHTKGRYAVKEGDEHTLKPMREALVDRGIGATLEYD